MSVKMLIVEDSKELINEVLVPRLEKEFPGVSIVLAHNVEEVAQFAAHHDFDVVILDMHMPLDGDLGKQDSMHEGGLLCISRYKWIEKAKVVVFTAWPSFENARKCGEAGVDAYVPKDTCRIQGVGDRDKIEGGVDELIRVIDSLRSC